MKCEWVTSECLASDSIFWVDGRLSIKNVIERAVKVRESFEANFPNRSKLMIKFKCERGVFYV